jgi:flagellar basal body-associated protein FliL
MRKRNRAIVLLLLPIAVFLWLIGWSFLWIGSKEKSKTPKRAPEPQATSMMIMVPEEECAV